jgi:hypothetical protein
MGTDHHKGNFSPAADEEANLPVDLPGEGCQLPRQIMGDYTLRRHPPPVELFNPFDLRRCEAGQVSVNFIHYLNLCGLTFLSMVSRNFDQEFVRKAVASFFGFFAPHSGHSN